MNTPPTLQQLMMTIPGYAEFTNRRYKDWPDHSHPPFKAVAHTLASMALQQPLMETMRPNHNSRDAGLQTSLYRDMHHFGFPFWLTSKSLMDALVNTNVPDEWDTSMVGIPFRTCMFVLPRGVFKGDQGEDITIITAHLSPDPVVIPEGLFRTSTGQGLFGVLASSPDTGRTWWHTVPVDGTTIKTNHEIAVTLDPSLKYFTREPVDAVAVKNTAHMAMALALQIIHVMSQAQPDDGNPPVISIDGTRHVRNTKQGNPLFTTPWIGKTYKPPMQRKPAVTGHATPGTHWRRGHFANQRHGKGNTLVKTIWRQPVLVNP